MDVFELVAKLSLNDSEYRSGLNSAQSMASSAGSAIGGALSTGLKVATAAVGAATTAVAGFTAASVKTGASFDKSMSQVAATMGKTVDQIGELRDFAQEMGRTTAFSATQAADALNYMALAGYDTTTSMKMLPNVLNLAAAGNFDLARASDMVTDTQTAFGLTLERTSLLVDEMAKAASTGNTSVEQLGDAFLVVGGLAQELNGGFVSLDDGTEVAVDGIQELEIALTAMANAGVKGGEAGTHMRNMLLKLSSPTSDGTKALEAMGVAVFDTEGKMRSLADIFGDLNNQMSNMSQSDKINVISDLFNARDTAAAEALLKSVEEDWDKIGASILDAKDAAEQMAKTQLDNLAGDVTLFQSALEGLQIAISDNASGALRDFVRLGTEGIGHLTTLFTEFDATPYLDEMGRMTEEGARAQEKLRQDKEAAMQGVFDTLTAGLDMIIDMIPDLLDAGAKVLGALVKGITDNIDSIIDAAGEIFDSLMQGMLQASESGTGIGEVIDKIVSAFMNGLGRFFETGTQILLNIAHGITDSMPNMVGVAADIIAQFCQFVIDSAPDLISAGVDIILSLATGIGESLPELVPMAVEAILTVVQGLVDNVDKVIDAALAIIEGLATGLLNALPVLIEKAPEITVALVKGMLESLPKIFDLGIKIITELVRSLIENAPKMMEAAFEIITSLAIGAINAYAELDRAGRELIDKLRETIFSFDFISWGADMINGIVNGIKSGIGSLGDAAKEAAGNIAKFLHFSVPDEGPLSDADTYGPDLIELLASGIENNVGSLAERIRAALDTVKQVFVTFMEETVALFNGDEGLLTSISTAFEEWSNLLINETLPNLFTQIRDIVVIYLSEDSEIVSSIRAFFERINMEIESFLGSESGIVTKLTAMFVAIDGLLTTYLYGTIFTRVQTFFTQTTTRIATFVQKTTTDFTTLITKLTQGITKFFDTTVTLVTTKLQEILTVVQRFFTDLQTLVAKYIVEKTGLIPAMIDKSFKSIKEATEDLASGEKEGGILYTVSAMFEELIPLIEDSFYGENGIFTMVEELATKIAEVFEGLVEAATGWGSDMGANFAAGLASEVGAVSAAATALAEAAAAVLKHSVPKKGPLSDDDKWGGHLVENFVNGMLASKGLVTKALDNVFGFMPKAVALIGTDVTAREKEILQKAARVSVDISRGLGKEIIRLQEQIALDEIETNRNLTEKKKAAYSARLHELYRELGDAEGEEVTRIEKEIEKIRTKIDFTAEKTEYKTKLKELYEELGSAEEDEVEKIQSNITKLKEDWAQKEEQRNRDTVQSHITALQELKSAYDTELAAIESRQASFAEKMASYGSLFSRVTDSDTGKEMFKLGDLSKDIEQIKNYGDAIEEIKERGLPDGLMENILSMSIDDATDYMNELNKMTDAEYDKYIGLWQEKQQLAASIAQKYYQGEVDALKSNYFDKVLQEAQTLEENMDDVGKDAVKGMKEGMNSKLPSLLKAARKIANSVISEMKATMGIASPSKEMRDQVGIWITRGLADGMESGMPYLNNATDALMQTILDVGDGVGDTFIDGLVSGIQEGGEYLKDAISDIDGVMSANIVSDTNDRQAIGGYTQIINNYSPEPLDASEIARQTRNATQSMVLALRSA